MAFYILLGCINVTQRSVWGHMQYGRIFEIEWFDTLVSTCTLVTSLEKVPQDLFHSVYFEYEENCTHDRLLSLNYAFCHKKR